MTNSKNETIKIFSLAKLVTAFLIAYGIDLTRRLFEPASGPFDLFFIVIFAFFYALIFFVLVAIVGLLFYIPQLKDFWFKNKLPSLFVLFTGVACFLYGTMTANHIYFDLHKSGDEADMYLDYFAIPGYIFILFSLSFLPSKLFRSSTSRA